MSHNRRYKTPKMAAAVGLRLVKPDADAHLGRGAAKPIRRTRACFGLIQAVR
jgi:hypothetical protein